MKAKADGNADEAIKILDESFMPAAKRYQELAQELLAMQRVRIDSTTNDETGALLRALRHMNDSLVGIVSQVRTGTDAIATASGQISAGNLDLSARTEQQASSLEETRRRWKN